MRKDMQSKGGIITTDGQAKIKKSTLPLWIKKPSLIFSQSLFIYFEDYNPIDTNSTLPKFQLDIIHPPCHEPH